MSFFFHLLQLKFGGISTPNTDYLQYPIGTNESRFVIAALTVISDPSGRFM